MKSYKFTIFLNNLKKLLFKINNKAFWFLGLISFIFLILFGVFLGSYISNNSYNQSLKKPLVRQYFIKNMNKHWNDNINFSVNPNKTNTELFKNTYLYLKLFNSKDYDYTFYSQMNEKNIDKLWDLVSVSFKNTGALVECDYSFSKGFPTPWNYMFSLCDKSGNIAKMKDGNISGSLFIDSGVVVQNIFNINFN